MAEGTIMVDIIVMDTITIEADATIVDIITTEAIGTTEAEDIGLFQAVMDTIQTGAITIDIGVHPTEAIIIGDIEEAIPDPVIADPDMADIRNSSFAV